MHALTKHLCDTCFSRQVTVASNWSSLFWKLFGRQCFKIIFMPPPMISCQRHSVHGSVHARSCTKSLWTQYITTYSWEFHEIYNLKCSWRQRWTDYVLRSKGQSLEGQDHSKNKCTFPVEAYRLTVCRRPSSSLCCFIPGNFLEPLSDSFNYINCHVQARTNQMIIERP